MSRSDERRILRRAIREHLALLADHQLQRDYARDVPAADVPAELLAGWFDDTYHPESPTLQATFDPSEREALARFHAELADVVGEVVGLRTLDELQARSGWHRLATAAAEALRQLTAD